MSDWTAIYCFRPGWRWDECEPARLAVAELLYHFGPEHIVSCPAQGRNGYADAVRAHWDVPGDLIIIEQDMEPTVAMVQALLDCGALACSQAYWMAPASTGHFGFDTAGVPYGEEWAHHHAIGLCRLTEQVRRQTQPPPSVFWGDVEHYVNKAAQQGAGKWHIHYPTVPHHHGLRELPNAVQSIRHTEADQWGKLPV